MISSITNFTIGSITMLAVLLLLKNEYYFIAFITPIAIVATIITVITSVSTILLSLLLLVINITDK